MTRKKGALVLIILLCAVLWWVFGTRGYEITNAPIQNGPIVAFGDSLVFGTGAQTKGGFVTILQERLDENIINAGVPGDTTADGLKRLQSDVLSHNPALVLVLLGGNDVLQDVPKETTFSQLQTIVQRLQEKGAVVVLLGVRSGVLRDAYKGEYKQLAKDMGALFVPDVLDGLIGNPKYMSDAVHPNDAGYEIIAKKIEEVLRNSL
jgi:acyl-CoA thioesterase-1